MSKNISKGVITAAGAHHHHIPLQTVVDREGYPATVLSLLIEELLSAQVEQIALVVSPGDKELYRRAAGERAAHLELIEQPQPRGYGDAVRCTQDFVGDDSFLLMVSDHLYLSADPQHSCAQQLVAAAETHSCAVSAVQSTHESKLSYFGTVGGSLFDANSKLYRIGQIAEKPTPTFAEQELTVPGLRLAHYLCFFGMHILPPEIMDLLERQQRKAPEAKLPLTPALNEWAQQAQYLAVELKGRRYDLEDRYGLLIAQLALALDSGNRAEMLSELVELLAQSPDGTH